MDALQELLNVAGSSSDLVETTSLSKPKSSTIKIYTDGSCLKNPGGPGGWAWWCPTTRRHNSGHVAKTTNNRMEMQAILEAVKALGDDRAVRIYTDSQWALNVLTRRWKAKKNRDQIEAIWALPHWPAVRLSWVRGHNGHPDNEQADRLAGAAARTNQAEDDSGRYDEPSLAVLMGERVDEVM